MNIDPLVNRFRLASRELFNTHFLPTLPEGVCFWDWRDAFQDVERALFHALVVTPSPLTQADYGVANSSIRVIGSGDHPPVMINREKDQSRGYWDFPVKNLDPHAILHFVRFFDFNACAPWDHQYTMVWIDHFPSDVSASGRYALIEHQYVSYECVV